MSALWLVVICLINFGISWWNAVACGQMWKDRPAMGWFTKAVLYSAVVQSIIGFSSVIMVGMALLTAALLEPEQSKLLLNWMMSLWYVTIILPALGTGFILTLHSWQMFLRERSWLNFATSSWNTYAQISNTWNAVQSLGPALDHAGDALSAVFSGDSDSKEAAIARLALVIVAVSLIGGALLTATIMRREMARAELPSAPQKVVDLSRKRARA